MHLLPRVLGLLLLAAPCRAADERLEPYFGTWKGTITTSANECEWSVKLVFRPQGEAQLRGQFTYAGPCAKAPGEGYFNASPGGNGDCLKGMLSMPGFPGINGEACFDDGGDLKFKAAAGTMTLSLTQGGEQVEMQASSAQGTAEGTFAKQHKGAKAKKAKKTNAKKDKPEKPTPEVLIGGY